MARDGPFLIRVDGSARTGLGHVSRCLALSERLAARGIESFFAGIFAPNAREMITQAGANPVELSPDANLTEVAARLRARAILVDGYEFATALVESIAPATTGRPLVLIDDFASLDRYPEGSIVLNFTLRARELEYPGNALSLLRGPRFLLIRRATADLSRSTGDLTCGTRVLISLGNGDWVRLAARVALVVQAIAPEARVRVVGSPRPIKPALGTDLESFPSVASLAPHFEWADTCITGGGLTKYEACYLGLPTAAIPRTTGEEWDTRGFVSKGLAIALEPGADEETVATRLRPLIKDQRVRGTFADACAAMFTRDCTELACTTILDHVDRSWGAGSGGKP